MKLKICREYNVIGKVGAVAAQIQKHTTRRPCLCKMENKSDQGFGKRFVVWGLKLTFFVSAMNRNTVRHIATNYLGLYYLAYIGCCHGKSRLV